MRFSVVVPAYNEEAYLARTLSSLCTQDFTGSYEVIVVDNGSTDATAEIAESFGVRVLHEPERGVCAARQCGSAAAQGDYIVSADADTVYPRAWLDTIDARLQQPDHPVAVAGPCRYLQAPWWARAFVSLLFGLVAATAAVTGLVLYASATNLAMRRTAFPGYDTTLTQGGDELDLVRRLRRRGKIVWDRQNVVTTSPRRFVRGLLYSLVMSLIVHYLLAYVVNRLTHRQALGTAPAIRRVAASTSARHRVRR